MESKFVLTDRQENLAHAFIEEYLHGAGLSFKSICDLPAEEARQIMIKASVYASVKLAEIEDRAQLVESLHHTTDAVL
jgi:hypothetical protein